MTLRAFRIRSRGVAMPCLATGQLQAFQIGEQVFGHDAPVQTTCLRHITPRLRLITGSSPMNQQQGDPPDIVHPSLLDLRRQNADASNDPAPQPRCTLAYDPERKTDWTPAPKRDAQTVALAIVAGLLILGSLVMAFWPK